MTHARQARQPIRSMVPTLVDPFEMNELLVADEDILEVWDIEQYALVVDDEDVLESVIRPRVAR